MNGATVTEHATLPTLISVVRLRRVGLAFSSAGLLIGSLPSPDIGWLAWIALAPLLIACDGLMPTRAAALGFVTGMAANFGIYQWLFEVKGFEIYHFLILSCYFALYPAAWCAGIARLARHPRTLLFGAPALWVLLDYLRANAGFMAFPWGTLAHTQHDNLAILQVASITGEYGVTFLVALGNAAIAQTIIILLAHRSANSLRWNREATNPPQSPPSTRLKTGLFQRGKQVILQHIGVIVAPSIIGLAHALGLSVLHTEQPGPMLRVAAVQPSILLGERDTPDGRALVLNRLDRLSRKAAALRPALIGWPETAVAGNLRADPFLAYSLLALAHDLQTPIALGVGEVEKFAAPDEQGKRARRAYNSAYFMKPNGQFEEPYIKRALLPFGEYVPLETIIGWPAWLAPPAFNTVVGNGPKLFKLDDGTSFAPLICWENLFAPLARESVQMGARLLVVHTNDGWFGRSAAPRQHNLAAVLRAVENRVPIVISSNTGPSAIIDSYGQIVAMASGLFTETVVTGEVKLHSGARLYTRFGDVFVWLLIAGFVLGALTDRKDRLSRAAHSGARRTY